MRWPPEFWVQDVSCWGGRPVLAAPVAYAVLSHSRRPLLSHPAPLHLVSILVIAASLPKAHTCSLLSERNRGSHLSVLLPQDCHTLYGWLVDGPKRGGGKLKGWD